MFIMDMPNGEMTALEKQLKKSKEWKPEMEFSLDGVLSPRNEKDKNNDFKACNMCSLDAKPGCVPCSKHEGWDKKVQSYFDWLE